jgi:hypothetical protein
VCGGGTAFMRVAPRPAAVQGRSATADEDHCRPPQTNTLVTSTAKIQLPKIPDKHRAEKKSSPNASLPARPQS